MKKWDVMVAGQDVRTILTAQILQKEGLEVFFPLRNSELMKTAVMINDEDSIKAARDARVILGGIPFTKEAQIMPLFREGQLFFGGMLSEAFCEQCRKKGIACYDFMKEETIAVRNAVATAEGAIAEAMINSAYHLHGSNCLVLGFGRCGSVLSHKLKGLSAKVTVAGCKEEELVRAQVMGMETLVFSKLQDCIQDFLYIFNTIPARIIDKNLLERTQEKVLLIDIASGEGGIDYEAADVLGRKAILCPGLPGKYASASSAEYLAEFIVKKL